MIIVEILGREPLRIGHAVLDYNDTVAVDGLLLKGAVAAPHTYLRVHETPFR